jgi:DNA-binding response OmpR family regulator
LSWRYIGSRMELIVALVQETAGAQLTGMPSPADRRGSRPIALADVAQDVIVLDLGKLNVTVHEMVAWLRSADHRVNSSAEVNPIVTIGDSRIDLVAMTVTRSTGQRVRLTPTEWLLLEELLRHPGELVRRETLLTVVRGGADYVDPSYLRVYMAQLRRKLEPEPRRPRYLVTEPGMGYRFQP